MGADADEQLYPYLKCNIINCRATLTNIAIVTSCSHIFCPSCVDGRLINPGPNVPICPACGTALAEEGDIGHIQTTIPDNCQKVVLAGLHPIVISTLVDHGLRFWAYQAAQEIVYQEYVLNTARNDSKELSIDYERAINEATSKVETLTAQLEAITLTNQELVHKNNELGESFREKTSRCKKLQGELDRLRRKNLISHTQNAAAAIDQTISQPVPPGTSSGAARLSDMNAVPASPMRQNQLSGGEIGGQIPFTNGTNMSNILRGFEQHDSAMGNGNGDMSRVAMPPPNARVAGSGNMHANTRIGAAHNTSWPINALRENMGGVATPVSSRTHRPAFVPTVNGSIRANSMPQDWNGGQKSFGGMASQIPARGRHPGLHEISANRAVPRSSHSLSNIHGVGSVRPSNATRPSTGPRPYFNGGGNRQMYLG